MLQPLLGPSFVVWSPAQGRVETIPARSMSSAPALVQIKGRFIGWWWVVAGVRGGFWENEIKRESETGSSVTVGFVSPTLFHTLHQCAPPPNSFHHTPPCFPPGWRLVTKAPFVPTVIALRSSQHSSYIRISTGKKYKTRGGKKKAGTQTKVPEEGAEQLFPDQGRGPRAM